MEQSGVLSYEHWGAIGSLIAAGGTAAGRSPSGDRNELIVGTKDGTLVARAESNAISAVSADTQVTHRNEQLGYFTVEKPDGTGTQSVDQLKRELEQRSDVAYVEENATYETQRAPNDSRYDTQYAPQQVNAPSAWDSTLGSEDVTIAVIDQGAAYDHPDLQARFGSDKGKDFVDSDDDPSPDISSENHGTHVSGCASATTDNNEGVAGVSNSTLLSCRALSEDGSGSLTDISDAIQWAADQDIDIINMSLGGGGYSQTMKDAVSYAADNDVLIVCAAGNGYGSSVSYPAAYEECVAVSALDPDENLADFSNKGDKIDVASPGVNVLSSVPGGDYEEFSGTSMASPVAAGVAALGLAANSSLSASQLKQRLTDTAVDIGLSDTEQGAGRVDAANIVDAGGGGGGGGGNESPTASASAGTTTPTVGQSVTFDGSGSSDPDGSIASYEWDFGDGQTATGAQVSHTYSSQGDYTVRLTVTDDAGATATDSVTLSVQSGSSGGISDGTYKLVNVNSGKVLDIQGTSTSNGASCIQWDWAGVEWQKWQVENLGDGEYRITNKHSNKVVDVEGVSTRDGADVHQWSWWGGDNQKWRLESVGDGEYKIVSVNSGKVLDVSGASTSNRANVLQYHWHGGDNQRWRFEEV